MCEERPLGNPTTRSLRAPGSLDKPGALRSLDVCLDSGDPFIDVSSAIGEESKTSSKPDSRAAHGAARIDRGPAENSFFHGVELEARSEYAPDRLFDVAPVRDVKCATTQHE